MGLGDRRTRTNVSRRPTVGSKGRRDDVSRRPGAARGAAGHVGVEGYDGAPMAVPARSINDEPLIAYKTDAGEAWLGDAIETLDARLEDESVDLIVTSPPFALQRPKEYGNESQDAYKEWFLPFADEFWRVLKPTGSLVLDLGGAWEAGQPVKEHLPVRAACQPVSSPQAPVRLGPGLLLVQPRAPT